MPFHDVPVWGSPRFSDSLLDPPPHPSTSLCYSSHLDPSQEPSLTTEGDESVLKLRIVSLGDDRRHWLMSTMHTITTCDGCTSILPYTRYERLAGGLHRLRHRHASVLRRPVVEELFDPNCVQALGAQIPNSLKAYLDNISLKGRVGSAFH